MSISPVYPSAFTSQPVFPISPFDQVKLRAASEKNDQLRKPQVEYGLPTPSKWFGFFRRRVGEIVEDPQRETKMIGLIDRLEFQGILASLSGAEVLGRADLCDEEDSDEYLIRNKRAFSSIWLVKGEARVDFEFLNDGTCRLVVVRPSSEFRILTLDETSMASIVSYLPAEFATR